MHAGSDEGATALEYAILAALIALAIITAVGLLGGNLGDLYEAIIEALPFGS